MYVDGWNSCYSKRRQGHGCPACQQGNITWNMPDMTRASFGPQVAIPMSKHILLSTLKQSRWACFRVYQCGLLLLLCWCWAPSRPLCTEPTSLYVEFCTTAVWYCGGGKPGRAEVPCLPPSFPPCLLALTKVELTLQTDATLNRHLLIAATSWDP